MKAIWDRIHVWLSANAPEVLKSLRPGATDEQLRAAEAEMGVALPDDVKACYRIHDGQRCKKGEMWPPTFLYGLEWETLSDILNLWRGMKGLVDDGTFGRWRSIPKGPIRTDWWHPAWIPLTSDHHGAGHYLDLDPAAGGNVGQIIFWQNDDPGRYVESSSFTTWLAHFADELEAGNYVTEPGLRGLIHVDDPYWG
jgi:cell wall assembly regulator SMI1